MSRKTNNLKKRLSIERQQREAERRKESKIIDYLNTELLHLKKTLSRQTVGDDAAIVLRRRQDYSRPGRLYAFQVTVDFDWLRREVFHGDPFTDGREIVYKVRHDLERALETLIQDKVLTNGG